MEIAGIGVGWWIAAALVSIALGIESSRAQRNRKRCQEEGHEWTAAGMGDDPAVPIYCTRCDAVPR